jgi:radical SAM protein with 4Fe4S-binding SPASM domain
MSYLLVVSNLFCNHKCSYCIQQESSLDVRMNNKKVDVPALLTFLKRNRISRSVKLMGGESTLHPDFEPLMEGLLKLYRKVVFTTNVNGLWYKDFGKALTKMQRWGQAVKWNTTYHPSWMDIDLYIERIRAMRAAGLWLEQVAATDTPELTADMAAKLAAADIDWKIQPFTGRDPGGQLLPRSWDDVNTRYPLLYDPAKYIEHYDEYARECEDANFSERMFRDEWVNCTTSRFLIGPDNLVYPCHRHLYAEDPRYAVGSLHDPSMREFKHKWNRWMGRWTLPCDTKCNPCDFRVVKIKPTGDPTYLNDPADAAHAGAEVGAGAGA